MKKISFVLAAFAIISIAGTSCAKQCVCVRYEDGKKIAAMTSGDVKYFESSACTDQSQSSHQSYSWITEDKEVTVEVKCK